MHDKRGKPKTFDRVGKKTIFNLQIMKRKTFTALCIITVAIISGYGGMNVYQKEYRHSGNDLIVENVEALSQLESQKTCTRIKNYCMCTNSLGDFMGMRITEIEEYTPKSCVEICEHAQLTNCPNGAKC